MDRRKHWIKWLLMLLGILSAVSLYAASSLLDDSDAEARYSEQLCAELESRSFLKRQWSGRHAKEALQRAETALQQKQIASAVGILDDYLANDSDHHLIRWKQLGIISRSGTPRQIARAADGFLRHKPEFGPALLLRADAYQQMQQFRNAESDYQRALNDPLLVKDDRLKAGRALVSLLDHRGATPQAVTLLQQLLQQSPRSLQLHKTQARLLQKQQKFAEAERAWARIPALTNDKAEIAGSHAARAALLQRLGKPEEALLALDQSLAAGSLAHQDWNTRLRSAQLFLKKQRNAEALAALTDKDGGLLDQARVNANDQGYTYPSYLRTVADLALKRKNHSLAVNALTELNRLARSDAEKFKWLSMLGVIHANDGETQKALDYSERALALQEDRQTRVRAADAAWKIKDYKRAAQLLQPALQSMLGSNANEQRKLQLRLCEAQEKSGDYKNARRCNETLLTKQSASAPVTPAKASQAATTNKVSLTPSVKPLTEPSGTTELQAPSASFAPASAAHNPDFESGYAYANALLKSGKRDAAIILLARLARMKGNSPGNQYKAQHALGYAMAANGDFRGASQAWLEADKLRPTPVLKLRRAWALLSLDNPDIAGLLLDKVDPTSLPAAEQLTWHELRGLTFYKQELFDKSIEQRQTVVKRAATAKRWAQLAESYKAAGQKREADNALEKAIALSRGDKSAYVLQRAHLKLESKQHEAAEILLTQALQAEPENPLIEEELGYTYARLLRNDLAIKYLKLAIKHYQGAARAGRTGAAQAIDKRDQLNRQIARLEKGLTLTLQHTGNLGNVASDLNSPALLAPFRQNASLVEVAWQPQNLGYRNGSQLELFAQGLWNGRQDQFSSDSEVAMAGLGIRYKPLAQSNLWLSLEKLFGSGKSADDNLIARLNWSATRGADWPLQTELLDGRRYQAYADIFIDIAQQMENDDPTLALAEARLGQSWLLSEHWLLTPHAYLRGRGTFGSGDEQLVDVGLGVLAKQRAAYDFYQGYKIHSEWYLRLGEDLENNLGDKETRATLGFRLTY